MGTVARGAGEGIAAATDPDDAIAMPAEIAHHGQADGRIGAEEDHDLLLSRRSAGVAHHRRAFTTLAAARRAARSAWPLSGEARSGSVRRAASSRVTTAKRSLFVAIKPQRDRKSNRLNSSH